MLIWASKSWIKKERERNWKEKVIEKEGERERERNEAHIFISYAAAKFLSVIFFG